MPVTIERSASAALGLTNAPTISAQVDAANALLVSIFGYRANESANLTNVLRNAQVQASFQEITDHTPPTAIGTGYHNLELFSRFNPSTGTANITGTINVFKVTSIGYVVFNGVDSADPIPSADIVIAGSNTVTPTLLEITVPNMQNDDLAVMVLMLASFSTGFLDRSGVTVTDSPDQTRLYDQFGSTPGNGIVRVIVTTKTGVGAVTLGTTLSLGTVYGIIGFRVKGIASGPTITTQPSSQAIEEGSSVTFTSAASTGTSQWQEKILGSPVDMIGETSGSLSLTDVPASDDGREFRCAWTDEVGTSYSNYATLTVQSVSIPSTMPASDVLGDTDVSMTSTIAYDTTPGKFGVITGTINGVTFKDYFLPETP